MSLVTLNADLRTLNKLLERLARCAEVAVYNTWGIRMGHINEIPEDVNPREKESVAYANDPDTAKRELQRIAGHDEDEGDVLS